MSWASGALSDRESMPEIKQKQAQDRKTYFETVSLPVAEILRDRRQLSCRFSPLFSCENCQKQHNLVNFGWESEFGRGEENVGRGLDMGSMCQF